MIIYQPRFIDEGRTQVRAIARLVDGRILELEGDRREEKSDFIRDVFAQYSESEIIAFTERERQTAQLKAAVDEQSAMDRAHAEENELTFQAKAKALALPEVQNCTDRRLSRKIRKSKSAIEVAGWIAVAFMKSLDSEVQPSEVIDRTASQVV